jgi:hypothetical protein
MLNMKVEVTLNFEGVSCVLLSGLSDVAVCDAWVAWVAANAVVHAAWVATLFACQMYQVSLTTFCDEAHHMALWLVPAHLFHNLPPCVNSENSVYQFRNYYSIYFLKCFRVSYMKLISPLVLYGSKMWYLNFEERT